MLSKYNSFGVKLLGNLQKGKIFVISAPAGTGKTTLVKKLVKEFSCIKTNISYTTRSKRKGEEEGVDYHFIHRDTFLKKIKNNDFLEYVELYGDYYGTCFGTIEKLQNEGNHVVLVIDTEGGLKLKKLLGATLIFIMPPSIDELFLRLTNRKTESEEVIKKRVEWAEKEILDANHYDYLILNEELNTAYLVLKSIFIAEEHHL